MNFAELVLIRENIILLLNTKWLLERFRNLSLQKIQAMIVSLSQF